MATMRHATIQETKENLHTKGLIKPQGTTHTATQRPALTGLSINTQATAPALKDVSKKCDITAKAKDVKEVQLVQKQSKLDHKPLQPRKEEGKQQPQLRLQSRSQVPAPSQEKSEITKIEDPDKSTTQDPLQDPIPGFHIPSSDIDELPLRSARESLGILEVENLNTSFGESSLNPKDIIKKLNSANIFNTSAGLDPSSGTQDALIVPRKIIKSDSDCLSSSTTPVYSLNRSPFPTRLKLKSSTFLREIDDTVFKEKAECSPQGNADEILGNLSCIVEESEESAGELHQTNDLTGEEHLEMILKILSKSNISVEQKAKGQMFILGLSDILCSIKSSSSAEECSSKCTVNDSGNASRQYSQSFEKDKSDMYEVLDVRRKSCETLELDELPKNPINLSVISNDIKKRNRSLSHPNIKTKAVEETTQELKNNINRDVKVNVIPPTPTSTAKIHKIPIRKPSNITQKGPLGQSDMRRGSSITPEKPVPATSTRKAVTSAQDSKLKPLASSTPAVVNKDKMKTSVSMEPSEKSHRPLLPNSANKDSKQGSCSNKKDIKFPSSRMYLSTYEPSTSQLGRTTLGQTKVQKLKKADKENIPK